MQLNENPDSDNFIAENYNLIDKGIKFSKENKSIKCKVNSRLDQCQHLLVWNLKLSASSFFYYTVINFLLKNSMN